MLLKRVDNSELLLLAGRFDEWSKELLGFCCQSLVGDEVKGSGGRGKSRRESELKAHSDGLDERGEGRSIFSLGNVLTAGTAAS